MNEIVLCEDGEKKCPYIPVCITKYNDKTVEGCGVPLWQEGKIDNKDIGVFRLIKDSE